MTPAPEYVWTGRIADTEPYLSPIERDLLTRAAETGRVRVTSKTQAAAVSLSRKRLGRYIFAAPSNVFVPYEDAKDRLAAMAPLPKDAQDAAYGSFRFVVDHLGSCYAAAFACDIPIKLALRLYRKDYPVCPWLSSRISQGHERMREILAKKLRVPVSASQRVRRVRREATAQETKDLAARIEAAAPRIAKAAAHAVSVSVPRRGRRGFSSFVTAAAHREFTEIILEWAMDCCGGDALAAAEMTGWSKQSFVKRATTVAEITRRIRRAKAQET